MLLLCNDYYRDYTLLLATDQHICVTFEAGLQKGKLEPDWLLWATRDLSKK